jgi:hypothetical protein
MRKLVCMSLGAALLGAVPVPSLAQTATPADQSAKQKTVDPNEMVCERQESIGSRIASKRVCMTRAQWADRRLQDRQELDRVQIQRGAKGE